MKAPKPQALIRYDAMRAAIAAAYKVDEVKAIRDRAPALEAYTRQAKDYEAERRVTEIRLRAERKAGQLLAEMDKAKGARERGTRRGTTPSHDTNASKTQKLSDLGISHDQSSRWQKLATVPEKEFEQALKGEAMPSTNALIDRARNAPLVKPLMLSESPIKTLATNVKLVESPITTVKGFISPPRTSFEPPNYASQQFAARLDAMADQLTHTCPALTLKHRQTVDDIKTSMHLLATAIRREAGRAQGAERSAVKEDKMKSRGMGYRYLRKRIWWIGYSVAGREFRESSGSVRESDAIALLKQRLGDAAHGRPVGNMIEKTTLDDLIGMVEQDYIANVRASITRMQQGATHLVAYFGGDCRARDLTSDAITSYTASRLEQAKPGTINYELAILKRALHLGARAGKVGAMPYISMLQLDNARKGFFETNDLDSVLSHLPEHLRPLLEIAALIGWRVTSELLTRCWKDIDLVRGVLTLHPGEGKTRRGRSVPLIGELRSLFEQQRAYVRAIEQAQGRLIKEVFVWPDGSPVKDFRKAWKKACAAAGRPGALVHDLRRTAVRNFERSRMPRSAAMATTGHRTMAVYSRYAITDEAMMRESMEQFLNWRATETRTQTRTLAAAKEK